ncbi:PspC domain-containing protein [Mucilaginibacter sp.]|uniref:PspC domain-containing protein n=1 Tax=Mucilaginibacter sp. TaxID=1882438 RepID=UPI003D0C66BF
MNKTIIININGIVFHIEEDAYEILKSYMTDVKRHFSTSADSLEITTDIENRIAEMFAEILARENKQVIVEQDVNIVVEQMGSVADFEHAENDAAANASPFTYNTEGRRLFRDPDDHLVGGVCAGIANYFDIDPVWIRLAFALFTPVAGSGFLLYVILWIILPKAVTRADRMAMKGEKQNLQGFKKNFEDELSSVRQNLTNFGHEARPFVYKARDFAGDFFHHLGVFLGGTGKVLIKLLGVLLLLACFGGVIALVVALIAFVALGKQPVSLFPFNVIQNHFANKVYISAFFVAFIPLLTIILLIIKGIFNTASVGKSTGTVLLALWICALGMLVFYATRISAEFRESASFTETINIKPTANNTYYLKLNDIKYFSHEDSVRLDIKDHFRNMIVTDNDNNDFHNEPNSVTINIEKSDVDHPILEESFRANGGNYDDALYNARSTRYVFAQLDTILRFDYTLRRRPGISWHAEEVTLTLKVPLNATVIIDQRLDRYLHDINIYDCKVANMHENATMAAFVMTNNGLQCKIDSAAIAKKDTSKAIVQSYSTQSAR